jgi:hypothetical protein
MKEASEIAGISLGLFLERLKSNTETLEFLAGTYRAMYERVRAEVEGTGEFGVCTGDVDGRKWDRKEYGVERRGPRNRKGKEWARDIQVRVMRQEREGMRGNMTERIYRETIILSCIHNHDSISYTPS